MCEQHRSLPGRRTVLAAAAAAAAGGVVALLAACSTEPEPPRTATSTPAAAAVSSTGAPSVGATAALAAAHAGVDDPRSLAVVVDKRRPLHPRSWTPPDLVAPRIAHTNAPLLRRAAARALEGMAAAARADGVTLVSLSAYRSYAVQRHVYDHNLTTIGRTATEKLTLRPGYSEHQTGLAVDLGGASRAQDLSTSFAATEAYRWLRAHGWRHGWILRYESGRTAQTGIQFEPWHWRYLGQDGAAAYHRAGAHVLERFSGLPAAPGYA